MTMIGGESARRAKPTMESVIDQVDKLRREASESQMYAKLILSTATKLEEQIAVLVDKCSEPGASPPEEVEVIDLEEEEENSGGMNPSQRGHQRGVNDDLVQFKKGMKNDCGKLQYYVDNLLNQAKLLSNHLIGPFRSNSKSASGASLASPSTYSMAPGSNTDGRRSPTSATGLIKTEDPKGRAETLTSSPISLDSPGQAGFPVGLEEMNEGRISTMTIQVTEQSSFDADAVDSDDPGPGSKAHDNQLKKIKRRKSSSKPAMGVPTEKGTTRATTPPHMAKSPRKQHEVANRTRVGDVTTEEPESTSGFSFHVVEVSDENRTVPISPSGLSTQTKDLLPETRCTTPKQTDVIADTDPLANLEIESQSVPAIGSASSSKNVPPSLPPIQQMQTSNPKEIETPGHSEPLPSHQLRNGDTALECIFCNKTFGNQKVKFEEHILSHIGERPNFCNLCPFESSYKGHLDRHLGTHKSASERQNKCTICPMGFCSNNHLQNHIQGVHMIEKQFQCEICQKLFRRKGNLKQHIAAVHEKKRPFQCQECQCLKAFPTEHKLRRHMQVHTQEKNHRCGFCSKTFAYKSTLDEHIRAHIGECPKCRFCGKSFTTGVAHRLHERKHQQ